MTQPIAIIGAGLSGLTLSRTLLHHGIPFTLYQKGRSPPRHSYAITLQASAYRPLIKILDISEDAFRSLVAVDAKRSGLASHGGGMYTGSSFRANKRKVERLLRRGLFVHWKHMLENVAERSENQATQASATPDELLKSHTASLVIGADGVHSTVRNVLLPSASVEVLPYVAFNGQGTLTHRNFRRVNGTAMKDSMVIETRRRDALFSISINETRPKLPISVSWTYSRPARGPTDVAYRPDRPVEDAEKYVEMAVSEFGGFRDLERPFSNTFNASRVREDEVKHWLMRTTSAPLPALQDLLAKSGVCLMGDAVHAEPIIGGNGANAAIIDGLTLGEAIASGGQTGISKWYDDRYPVWKQGVEESRKNIARVHQQLKETASSVLRTV
ncbi:FAD/NAD(P)-binding domain-containing protein [Decorospora gaudefroyi]|uniref:FAD/NAD(P)-binding domain-containing protein n=1 Tax=Decorospora gaudefroyi TaxID=184978 RepID=A0A6A5KK99_9PLEO|nr:FAD/NAD(P)-binding domain-containing protein [Decorospora gaudefroyi]